MDEENKVQRHTVELNRATFDWHLDQGRLSFFGIPSVLFWLDPSLLRMLRPLVEEVGVPLFRLLVASQSSLGTDEDYHAMVTTLGTSFEEGFLAWGKAVSTAGWGSFELAFFDESTCQARVIAHNPWELQMQQGVSLSWGCPFLQGKVIGILSHALKCGCWADERVITATTGGVAVEFTVYPSEKTINAELAQLRREMKQEQERELAREVERKTEELLRVETERARLQENIIRMQADMLAELQTPLIPINEQVVMMPLVGSIDSGRAQQVLERLLHGVMTYSAHTVILDITGVPVVDTDVANALLQAAQAVRLVGAQVILTGIAPEVAETVVALGLDLSGIITKSTVQSGIAFAMSRTRDV